MREKQEAVVKKSGAIDGIRARLVDENRDFRERNDGQGCDAEDDPEDELSAGI